MPHGRMRRFSGEALPPPAQNMGWRGLCLGIRLEKACFRQERRRGPTHHSGETEAQAGRGPASWEYEVLACPPVPGPVPGPGITAAEGRQPAGAGARPRGPLPNPLARSAKGQWGKASGALGVEATGWGVVRELLFWTPC